MFDSLSDKLDRAFKVLKGQGQVTEINVAETVKEIRRALLDADVSYKVAKKFTDTVKEKALGQNVIKAVSPNQLMVKITHDELANLMGGGASEINLSGNPAVILIAGLQGSGKTTLLNDMINAVTNSPASMGKFIDKALTDSGKEKRVNNNFLVNAHNVREAYDRIETSLKDLMVSYEIPKIQKSSIVEI